LIVELGKQCGEVGNTPKSRMLMEFIQKNLNHKKIGLQQKMHLLLATIKL
jgi:hypothetical protein